MEELGNPAILARVPVMKPREKEQLLHNRFAPQRVPQTEYFQLDEQQLEFVLNACNSWMAEVQKLTVEPHIPEGVQLDQASVKAQPIHGFPKQGEDLREFIERPARERRESLAETERRKAQAQESHRKWAELWLSSKPETPLEAEKREREEYQAWVKSVEDRLKPPD